MKAKERLQRFQVETNKWQVRMQVANDPHIRKQMQLKHSVAVDMVKTVRSRLHNFEKKLKVAQDALSKTASEMLTFQVQEKRARASWTLAERQWGDMLQQVRKDQSQKLGVQKLKWQNEIQMTSVDHQLLLAKHASLLEAQPELKEILLQKVRFALIIANASKSFYQSELNRVRMGARIQKIEMKKRIAITAHNSAKAKASSMALAATEAEAMKQAQRVRQAKQIERNSRRVALLRAESVARLTKHLSHATAQELSVRSNSALKLNATETEAVTILKFRLDKAKQNAVAAVKEVHKYSSDQMRSKDNLFRLKGRVQKYQSAYTKQTKLATKSQLLLDKITKVTDNSVAMLAKVSSKLVHATQQEVDANNKLKACASATRRAMKKKLLSRHKGQVSSALLSAKESERKTAMAQKLRSSLKQSISATNGAIVKQVNIQAEAHVQGHACLVALERARSELSVLEAKRHDFMANIEAISDKQTQEDDHVSELRIKVNSASQRGTEHSLSEMLKAHEITVNQLQEKLAALSQQTQNIKRKVLEKTKDVSTQDSLLAKTLAKAKAAREDQHLLKSGLGSKQAWFTKLQKDISGLQEQSSKQVCWLSCDC